MKIGLVLEGGGLRASYTIGVLDCFMDKKIETDYCIGVSAGACHGVSYVSKQRGRSRKVNSTYASDPRYIGIGNLIKNKSIFVMQFIFDNIPNELVPFE
ncbi:MAG: patatin-like phospholipase family protein, partial [Oscillospiraceae bacterium]